MLSHLDLQRSLEHLLRQPGQQAARTGQLHTLRAGRSNQSFGQRRHPGVVQPCQFSTGPRLDLIIRHA